MAPSPGTMDSYAIELQALEDYRNFSAITIQRYYRGWIVRLQQARQQDAKQQQQQAATSAAQTQQLLYNAARTIQDAWRSFNNKRIYRFYRNLVRFKEAGDPRHMLRCINTREAALIDPAAGLHVRFRLGGSSFPPLVFYKIYTHRPVTDIGAFGPRNYAAEAPSPNSPASSQTKPGSSSSSRFSRPQQYEEYVLPAGYREYIKPDGTVGYRSTKGWYRRVDNNGWRPVAERLLLGQEHQAALPAAAAGSCSGSHGRRLRRKQQRQRHRRLHQQLQTGGRHDEVGSSRLEDNEDAGSSGCEDESEVCSGSSGRSSPVYHYSSIVRREDRARKIKQRRRQWLLKMYRTGMQAAAGTGQLGGPSSSSSSSVAAQSPQHEAEGISSSSKASGRSSDTEEQLLQLLERKLLQESALSTAVAAAAAAAAGVDTAVDVAADAEWDIDELVTLGLDAGILAWSQMLDFDSYQQHWNSTAVTLGSEAAVPVSEAVLLQQLQEHISV